MSDMWTLVNNATGECPSSRGGHTSTVVGDQIFLLYGYGRQYFDDVYALDPVSHPPAWTRFHPQARKEVPPPRNRHSATLVGSKLITFGGYGGRGRFFDDLNVLDTDLMYWRRTETIGNPPVARGAHGAALVGDKHLYIHGGYSDVFYGDLMVMDLERLTWTRPSTRGKMPEPRGGHVFLQVGKRLVVFGGHNEAFLNDLHILHLDVMRWEKVRFRGTPPEPRAWSSSLLLEKDLFVFGGFAGATYFNDIFVLDTDTMEWRRDEHDLPTSLAWHTASLVENTVALFGGFDGSFSNELYIADVSQLQRGRTMAAQQTNGDTRLWHVKQMNEARAKAEKERSVFAAELERKRRVVDALERVQSQLNEQANANYGSQENVEGQRVMTDRERQRLSRLQDARRELREADRTYKEHEREQRRLLLRLRAERARHQRSQLFEPGLLTQRDLAADQTDESTTTAAATPAQPPTTPAAVQQIQKSDLSIPDTTPPDQPTERNGTTLSPTAATSTLRKRLLQKRQEQEQDRLNRTEEVVEEARGKLSPSPRKEAESGAEPVVEADSQARRDERQRERARTATAIMKRSPRSSPRARQMEAEVNELPPPSYEETVRSDDGWKDSPERNLEDQAPLSPSTARDGSGAITARLEAEEEALQRRIQMRQRAAIKLIERRREMEEKRREGREQTDTSQTQIVSMVQTSHRDIVGGYPRARRSAELDATGRPSRTSELLAQRRAAAAEKRAAAEQVETEQRHKISSVPTLPLTDATNEKQRDQRPAPVVNMGLPTERVVEPSSEGSDSREAARQERLRLLRAKRGTSTASVSTPAQTAEAQEAIERELSQRKEWERKEQERLHHEKLMQREAMEYEQDLRRMTLELEARKAWQEAQRKKLNLTEFGSEPEPESKPEPVPKPAPKQQEPKAPQRKEQSPPREDRENENRGLAVEEEAEEWLRAASRIQKERTRPPPRRGDDNDEGIRPLKEVPTPKDSYQMPPAHQNQSKERSVEEVSATAPSPSKPAMKEGRLSETRRRLAKEREERAVSRAAEEKRRMEEAETQKAVEEEHQRKLQEKRNAEAETKREKQEFRDRESQIREMMRREREKRESARVSRPHSARRASATAVFSQDTPAAQPTANENGPRVPLVRIDAMSAEKAQNLTPSTASSESGDVSPPSPLHPQLPIPERPTSSRDAVFHETTTGGTLEERKTNVRAQLGGLLALGKPRAPPQQKDRPAAPLEHMTRARVAGPTSRRAPTRGGKKTGIELVSNDELRSRNKKPDTGSTFLVSLASLQSAQAGLKKSGGGDAPSGDLRSTKEKPRLFQIKGRRKVRTFEVACHYSSLNHGDTFILDLGKTLYIWNGMSANRMEKAKAVDVASRIRNKERSGRATVITLEDEKTDDKADFWEALGGKGELTDGADAGDDEVVEQGLLESTALYKLEEPTPGNIQVTTLAQGKGLSRELLQSDYNYILDSDTEMYVWVGKNSKYELRQGAMKVAKDMLERTAESRPAHCRIYRVVENTPTVLFQEKFLDWPDTLPIQVLEVKKGNIVGSQAPSPVELAKKMVQEVPKEEKFVDKGDGAIEMHKVDAFKKDPTKLPVEELGHFFSGESYILPYKYRLGNRDAMLIHFWQGRDSSVTEKGTSAYVTVDMHSTQQRVETRQERVIQNKESKHFLSLFKGRMIVHQGDHASYDPEAVSMYHIAGSNYPARHAIEIRPEADHLNSRDCFILQAPGVQYVWCGSGSKPEEQEVAVELADRLVGTRVRKEVTEGSEPNAFWEVLGGRLPYNNSVFLKRGWQPPKLFSLDFSAGQTLFRRIHPFCQDDLTDDKVFIMDASYVIYCWLGEYAKQEERKLCMETGKAYKDLTEEGRPAGALVKVTETDHEPPDFFSHFHGWIQTVPRERRRLKADTVDECLRLYSRTYTYKELTEDRPRHLDNTRLEGYLVDEEFEDVFHCTKEEFYKLPEWHRVNKRKEVGLY